MAIKHKKEQRENNFLKAFNEKKKMALFFKTKHKVTFTRVEFNDLSLPELVKLGNERVCRFQTIKREKDAAKTIQKHWRIYASQRSYREYARQYQINQRRVIAALKIQLFYREYKRVKNAIKQKEESKEIQVEKKKFVNFFTDYVVRFNYLKPRLHALLKQLDRLLKGKRHHLVISAAVLLQYHIRKWLKRLAAKRVVKVVKKKKKIVSKIRPLWQNPSIPKKKKEVDPDKEEKVKQNLNNLSKKYNPGSATSPLSPTKH